VNKFDNFPSINCITLETSFSRQKTIKQLFEDNNLLNYKFHIFKHIEQYDHKIIGPLVSKVELPALGATTSHLKSWKDWYENTDEPYTIFCEDDIVFDTVQYWNFTWKDFFEHLPKNWDCIQLSLIQEILTPINFRRRGLYDWGANIYLVKREYVKTVLDKRYINNTFIFDITETNLPPVIEHVLYLPESNIYMFPLFLENINIDSTVTPKEKYEQTFINHVESHKHVLNWWKTEGYLLNINEIIMNLKHNEKSIYEKFALNTEDPDLNFNLALHYHNLGQTASAFTNYFRCAERTTDNLLKYECFIRSYMCFSSIGKRDFTAIFLLKQALTILPKRPEAYYLLSKYYEHKRDWMECYTITNLAIEFCDFKCKPLKEWTEYSGQYCIYFQKAVAAWWLDKAEEAWTLFNYILDNFNLPQSYINTINNNLNNHFKDRRKPEKNKTFKTDITLPKEIKQTKNIVDCFPFNPLYGKEMFELRYNILKDYVDYFVVSELNTTHTGKPIEYGAKKLLQELNISEDKVIILEIDTPGNDDLPIEEIDKLNCMYGNDKNLDSVRSRCRERIQRDAVLQIYDKFNDNTVFINSDLDEIINPKYLQWFADTARQNKDYIIKAPLVYLQGKANLRTYYKDSDTPAPWNENLFLCLKEHFKNTTPTKVRSCKLTTYPIGFVTSNNKTVEDVGWHFSWMGDATTKKIKQESFIHHTDKFNFVIGGGYDSSELDSILLQETEEGQIPPSGETDKTLKQYDINLLPKEIFTLDRVKNFLLPKISSHKRIHLDSLDTILSSIYGFCSSKKASVLINLILDNKPNIVVELGILEGSSLIPQALAVKQNNHGKVYAVDPWSTDASLAFTINDEHKNYWGNIDHEKLYNNFKSHLQRYNVEPVVEILRTTSLEASKNFFINSIDLLHIDGNHSEEQSYEDVVTYLPLISKNGFILFDDVHWTDGNKNTTQKAVLFLQEHCNELNTYTDEIGNCFTVFQKK